MLCTQELAQLSADFSGLFVDIIEVLHQVALSQAVPSMLETVELDASLIKELGSSFSPEDVQLFYQIALIGRRDLYLSTTPQSALEMTLLRMLSFKPLAGSSTKFSTVSEPGSTKQNKTTAKVTKNTLDKATGKTQNKPTTYEPKTNKNNHSLSDLNTGSEVWPVLIEELGLQGVSYSLASNCSVESVADDAITLHLAQQHEGIATKGARQRLEKALQEYFSSEINLKFNISNDELETPARKKDRAREIKQSQAEKSAEEDAAVKALKSQFGAEIIEGTVKPVEN
jgi:DNA polymerase-3 subunit gamma/tau